MVIYFQLIIINNLIFLFKAKLKVITVYNALEITDFQTPHHARYYYFLLPLL